jgi:magnesium chelatase family protein
MNPCPCGFYNHPEKECVCGAGVITRYLNKISGPLLDRIDLHVPVLEVPKALLLGEHRDPSDEPTLDDVLAAVARQVKRQGKPNAGLTGRELDTHAALDGSGKRILGQAADRYRLSARGFHRVLRVARSIADLDGEPRVSPTQLTEALSYRAMDWSGSGASSY